MTAAAPRAEPRRPRARRGEGEHLRQEVLAAAERLLIQSSDESAVSIRAVAEAVGVTPPAIYLHFSDKDELILAVCEKNFEAASAAVEQAAAGAGSKLEGLELAAMAYARFGVEHPEVYRILFMQRSREATERREADRLLGSSGFNYVLATVRELLDEGVITGADPFVVTVGMWSVVHGITSLMISRPAIPWPPLEDWIRFSVRTYLKGLQAGDG